MLNIKNLNCGYIHKEILHNISVRISPRELVAIIGPNGSGKTTFLKTITRFLKPTSGTIEFEGQPITELNPQDLARKIAVVVQQGEPSSLTVQDFVLLGRIPYFKKFQFWESKQDVQIARQCMELTDTLRFKDCLMNEISGGEQQLCLIARALTQQPQLLLLDEPTTHLDITHQLKILDLIQKLNKELGLTVLMILHELNLAGEYCDRLLLIHQGQLVKKGTPQEVLTAKTMLDIYQIQATIEQNPLSGKPIIIVSAQSTP